MTLSDIYNRIISEIGEVDDSTNQTRYYNWINEAQREIANSYKFSWRFKRGVIQASAQYTTGTITATTGSPNVVFTGTIPTWADGDGTATQFISRFEIDGDATRYLFKTRTDANNGVLDRNVEGSGGSGLSHTLTRLNYACASDCDEIVSMKYEGTPIKLYQQEMLAFEDIHTLDTITGAPDYFLIAGRDADGYLLVRFYPIPITVMSIDYLYLKTITALTQGTDDVAKINGIPVNYHDLIVYYGLYKAYMFYGDNNSAKTMYSQYQLLLSKLQQQDKHLATSYWIFGGDDSGVMRVPRLPYNIDDYPYIGEE